MMYEQAHDQACVSPQLCASFFPSFKVYLSKDLYSTFCMCKIESCGSKEKN